MLVTRMFLTLSSEIRFPWIISTVPTAVPMCIKVKLADIVSFANVLESTAKPKMIRVRPFTFLLKLACGIHKPNAIRISISLMYKLKLVYGLKNPRLELCQRRRNDVNGMVNSPAAQKA